MTPMKKVRLLANKLYLRDKQDEICEHKHVIITFCLGEEDYLKLSRSVNNEFVMEIDSFEIEKFTSESPGVLYVDKSLMICKNQRDVYELSSI